MTNQIPDKLLQRMQAGREYRRMVRPLEARDAEGEQGRVVQGYACTFNEFYELYRDAGYLLVEQIDPAAFDGCDMTDVIMQYDHQGRVFARNKNGTLQLSTDEHGLAVRADLSGTELGEQVYQEIRGGYSDKMSFGFTVERDKREVIEDADTGLVTVQRTILKIRKLYDVSVVSIPANDATEIFARGLGEGAIAWAAQELRAHTERQEKRKKLALKLKLNS